MLVYDIGGGTFDASLVVVQNGVVEVKASHGNTHLGVDDFDRLLLEQGRQYLKCNQGNDALHAAKKSRQLKNSADAASLAFMAWLHQQKFDAATKW